MHGVVRKVSATLGVVLLVATTGCGGSGGDEGGPASKSSAAADPCALLDKQDVQAVIDGTLDGPTPGGNEALQTCRYDAKPAGDGLNAVAGAAAAAVSVFAGSATAGTFESNTAGGTPVDGVGEMAAEVGTAIYFLKSERLYAVDVSGDGVTPADRSALAQAVAARL